MSRWWPERLVAAPADVADAARSVASVLASFEIELDTLQPRRGARLDCIVGGEAVRLRVVPWNNALTSTADRRVLASQCFVEACGDEAANWVVREGATRYGEATLAAAIDPELVAGLGAMARARGLRLASIQPSLMHAFNARRNAIGTGLTWFVWVERHVTTALLSSPRAPRIVKRYAVPHAALATLLAREWFSLGIEEPPCPAFVDRSPNAVWQPPAAAPAADSAFAIVELPRPVGVAFAPVLDAAVA